MAQPHLQLPPPPELPDRPFRYAFGQSGKLYRLSAQLVARDYNNPYVIGASEWSEVSREAMRPEGLTAYLVRSGKWLEPSTVVALRFGGVVKWYVSAIFMCTDYHTRDELEASSSFLFPIPPRSAAKAVARYREVAAYAGSSLLGDLQPTREWFDMEAVVREGLAEVVDEHAVGQPASLLRIVMAIRPLLGRYTPELERPCGWEPEAVFNARTVRERSTSLGYERSRWIRKEPTPMQKRLVGAALHQLTLRQRACAPFETALCADLRRHIYEVVARGLVESKGKVSLWDVLALRSVCCEARSVVDDVARRVVDELQCVPRLLRESKSLEGVEGPEDVEAATLAECAKGRCTCLRYGFDPLLVEAVLGTEPHDGRSLFTVVRIRSGCTTGLGYKRLLMQSISEVGYENTSLVVRRDLDVRPMSPPQRASLLPLPSQMTSQRELTEMRDWERVAAPGTAVACITASANDPSCGTTATTTMHVYAHAGRMTLRPRKKPRVREQGGEEGNAGNADAGAGAGAGARKVPRVVLRMARRG